MTKEEREYRDAMCALNKAAYRATRAASMAKKPTKVILEMAWKTDEIVDGLAA